MKADLNAVQVSENLPLVKGAEETYPFLSEVIKNVLELEKTKKLTLGQLNRFALVLLFVDYRAANSQMNGRDGFTTLSPHNSYQEKRFKYFNDLFDPVESTTQYCAILKIGFFSSLIRSLKGSSMDEYLLKFVINEE